MFKTIAKQHLAALEVAASARQFKDQVQQGLETLLASRLRDGETLPDLILFQELIGRLLDTNGNELTAVDGRYTQELISDSVLRVRRDELRDKLRTRMADVRYMLDRSVHRTTVKFVLRDRRLSSVKPIVLLQGARDLIATLRDPKHGLEDLAGTSFTSASSLAAMLEEEANALEQVLLQLSPQKKASQDNLGVKVAEVRNAAGTNRRCTEALFGLYRLVGLDFHAERLRQRARTKRRVEEPEASPSVTPEATPAPMSIN